MPKGIKGFQKGHKRLNSGKTLFKKGHIKKTPVLSPKNKMQNYFTGRIKPSTVLRKFPSHKKSRQNGDERDDEPKLFLI